MIVVKLIGGLGNQLFQYAVAKALSIEKKQSLHLDISEFQFYKIRNYALDSFNIKTKIYKKPNPIVNRIKSFFESHFHYKEIDFGYNEGLVSIEAKHIFLDGYFQSERYFEMYKNIIRDELLITKPLKKTTQKMLKDIAEENSVSIHFRRGDYLDIELHNTDKEEYYKLAIATILSKIDHPVFYVFSDDIEWVKENFKILHKTIFVDFNDEMSCFEDLKLMSSCKHNIIANSSFSWWGAWLNENSDKIVIAPKIWFNDSTTNTSDIIPSDWIKL